MGLRAHWKLRQKYGVKCADVWYKEDPDKVRVLEMGIWRSGGEEC